MASKSGLSFSVLAAAEVSEAPGGFVVEDLDGDGYSENESDCDDTDADVNPGVDEVSYRIRARDLGG